MRGQSTGAARPHARRRLGTGALVAGLFGALGLVAASPASAAVTVSINSPDNNAGYSSYKTIAVDGTVNYGSSDVGTATLTATDPDYTANSSTGCSFTVTQATYGGPAGGTYSADIAGTLDLSAAYPKSCTTGVQGRPAVNGSWKITLSTTSGTSVTNTFNTAVPPAAPAGVKAGSGSPLRVTVTWTPNAELDTHAYAVLDGSGGIVSGPTDASSACSSSSCSATFGVSQSGSQSFSVRAYRYTAPPSKATSATTGDLTADSSAQSVNVQAEPADSASPAPTSGSGGGVTAPVTTRSSTPAPGSSAAPGSQASPAASRPAAPKATASRTTSARSTTSAGGGGITLHNTASSGEAAKISAQFQSFAAPVGIDKLPPLPKLNATTGSVAGLAPPASDDGEPTDPGTFKPTLGYAPLTQTVATRTVTAGAPLSFVADAIGVSPDALWRSLAGSLVLLLCAGHVRRWARQPIE